MIHTKVSFQLGTSLLFLLLMDYQNSMIQSRISAFLTAENEPHKFPYRQITTLNRSAKKHPPSATTEQVQINFIVHC